MTSKRPYYMVLTLATFLAACGDSTDPVSNAGNGDNVGNGGNYPVATSSVSVVDNSFNPSSVTVAVGTTVTWTWAGNNDHNVTFDDGVNDSATQTDGSHTRTFAAAGTFPYHCTIHGPSIMSGQVSVTAP